eukprot:TRINITY_DN33114_c0_g1_i2.p2 TRINITY_DN33114_c0_g1~~TRINITY_DN33114_c0_g1_i2.p2  ORF type:complete len:129 (-),score=6.90 TRINITY_DN33114_c0_g1_i2:90-476(-)
MGWRTKSSRRPCWQRLEDGDLCFFCLRTTARQRLALLTGAPVQTGAVASPRDVAGRNGSELRRQVPGIDYFPFEAGAGCVLPGGRPRCPLGPACMEHGQRHHSEFDHPWMRPTPEILAARRPARQLEA